MTLVRNLFAATAIICIFCAASPFTAPVDPVEQEDFTIVLFNSSAVAGVPMIAVLAPDCEDGVPKCGCNIWTVHTNPEGCWCVTGQQWQCPGNCCGL